VPAADDGAKMKGLFKSKLATDAARRREADAEDSPLRMTFSILDVVNEDTCITSLPLYL
jgi:hypothetical protein